MRASKKAGSSLFLMELIIVLFFFLLTAAICIQVFARAHSISRSSLELSHAQNQCSSVAEVFSGTDGSPEALLAKFPGGSQDGQQIEWYYDADFQSCKKEEAVYCLSAKQESDLSESPTRSLLLRFLRIQGDTELYSLRVRCHLPLTVGKEVSA